MGEPLQNSGKERKERKERKGTKDVSRATEPPDTTIIRICDGHCFLR
jgi:hypothetical protein